MVPCQNVGALGVAFVQDSSVPSCLVALVVAHAMAVQWGFVHRPHRVALAS